MANRKTIHGKRSTFHAKRSTIFGRGRQTKAFLNEEDELIDDLFTLRHQKDKSPELIKALSLFRGESPEIIDYEMKEFLKRESGASEILFLRMHGSVSESFQLIVHQVSKPIIYSNKKFNGMTEAVYKRLPVLLEKADTASWKVFFQQQPKFIILMPVTVVTGKEAKVMGTAVMVYEVLPITLEDETTWENLIDYLNLTLPLLVNSTKAIEAETKCKNVIASFDALSRMEQDIHDVNNCMKTMAYELSTLLNCKYIQVLFLRQELVDEKRLHKSCNVGNTVVDEKCPDKQCHENEDLRFDPSTPVGLVAATAKSLRANQSSDLVQYGLPSMPLHSIGGCFVDNIMLVPISDHAGEAPVVVELSQKEGGFTYQDEEQAVMFAKRSAAVLSSSVLLDYKKKAIRRHGIRNEVLANISEVSYFKVKQMLDLKFEYSKKFKKQLMDFRFTMRIFPDHQSPGVILHMFIDLGFVDKWQMQKATLIRFILSMQLGYRDIPYHNWKHACCVTHFCYILLKKVELVKMGYLTDLEALTMFISALAHDIDHRGRNNHFNLCTKSELYHLYKQEDSIMERHHIAVTLSILNSEDCNILEKLTDDQYREFLELIQWNILATDLHKYMHNRFEYFYTLTHFDQTNRVHRKHLSAVIMTCADLSDNTKTWDANLPTVKSIFHEFFAQGDDEIALGLKPMEMMDRRHAYKIPDIEIQFIHHVVRPVYHALAELLPATKICLTTLEYFEDMWLVSTEVFDSHINSVDDPLSILDMREMKEEILRRRGAPQLQKLLEKHGIAPLSIAHVGIKAAAKSSMTSIDVDISSSAPTIIDSKGHPTDMRQAIMKNKRRKSSIPVPQPILHEKLTCCEMTRNWMCCYLCKHRGLVIARAIRKFQLEKEFLEERATEHERGRQGGSSTSSNF